MYANLVGMLAGRHDSQAGMRPRQACMMPNFMTLSGHASRCDWAVLGSADTAQGCSPPVPLGEGELKKSLSGILFKLQLAEGPA